MTTGSILVVDDEPDLRSVYELALVREGYDVDTAASVDGAKNLLAKKQYQVMITDMRLPDGLGLELVKLVGQNNRPEKCLVVTAYGSAENAVEALKAGAFDYLTKPVNLKQLRQIVADALQPDENGASVVSAQEDVPNILPETNARTNSATKPLLGRSLAMQNVRNIIAKVGVTMAPVLVHGESGTGKELVAHAIHQRSHRAHGPFIAVNCGAIPENLMEAEFFGYRKGAFTGANEDRAGLFASAAGGTLFLDEIGELPLSMQAKLLRVIQERAVRPLGASVEEHLDVRIISATHRNLAQDVADGRFRQDLYYRLNVIEVIVPPLRERRDDIEEIARFVLEKICIESSLPMIPIFDPRALEQLIDYNFPGNVRELENILQRAVAMCDGHVIGIDDLFLHAPSQSMVSSESSPFLTHEPKDMPAYSANVSEQESAKTSPSCIPEELPADLGQHMDEIERKMLVKALEMSHFNRTAAAAKLGLSLRQIRYRMDRLGIDVPDGKGHD